MMKINTIDDNGNVIEREMTEEEIAEHLALEQQYESEANE